MSDFLLALDQGTTSTRCIAFSSKGDVVRAAQKPIHLSYPHNGWVEQDAHELWHTSRDVLLEVIKDLSHPPKALGITNQRETTILWDRNSGQPLAPAIVWQDRRTADLCAQLKAEGHEPMVQSKTGLLLDPYFSATKIKWILDNVAGARAKAQRGEVAFGTVDSWLLWNLTKGTVHATDASNAARTLLYNIAQHDWDEQLLELFDIPKSVLPLIHDNISHFGDVKIEGLENSLPIFAMAGDQQAALIGQECFEKGECKSTYGTGAFLLAHCGDQPILSQSRMLTTVAYRIEGKSFYALEGSIFIAGALIQWLRDNMKFFDNANETEVMAQSIDSSDGVYVVPAFTGLGAPWWQPDARGFITGLTRNSTPAHIVRASLEAQALQTYDLIFAMEKDMGQGITQLKIDGGLAANDFVAQTLADILQCDVIRSQNVEATSWGAAYLAGVGAGVIPHFGEKVTAAPFQIFTPQMEDAVRANLISGWRKAIESALN